MADQPYRTPSTTESVPTEPSESQRLGAHKLTCTPPPLVQTLVPVYVLVIVLAIVGGALVPSFGPGVFAVILPFAVPIVLLLAWSPFRRRNLRVELHASGLVVAWGEKRELVVFDYVDEVWMTFDQLRTPVGNVAIISALRLVLHDRSCRRVPIRLKGGEQIARAVLVHCSHPLQAQAAEALKAGETLTFGSIQVDRTSLRDRAWAIRWDEISLIRYAPGRLSIFRGQRFLPWRTIRLDRVPHPTVFTKVVTQYAPKVEIDDAFATLSS
jgi:hypothetical protein